MGFFNREEHNIINNVNHPPTPYITSDFYSVKNHIVAIYLGLFVYRVMMLIVNLAIINICACYGGFLFMSQSVIGF